MDTMEAEVPTMVLVWQAQRRAAELVELVEMVVIMGPAALIKI